MTPVVLARPYPSIWERPIIHSVDPRIFRLKYYRRCMECGFCGDQCCENGVDVDRDNAERVAGLGPAFEAFVGVAKEEWFDGSPTADDEFPSRFYVRARVVGTHCIFHDSKARGCKIHAWSLSEGLDHRTLKPMVSLLFPVTFEKGVLLPSTEVLDRSLVCTGNGDSLYAGARDELRYFFGPGLVDELDLVRGSLSLPA
jgi:hypothetical protein